MKYALADYLLTEAGWFGGTMAHVVTPILPIENCMSIVRDHNEAVINQAEELYKKRFSKAVGRCQEIDAVDANAMGRSDAK